VAGLLGEGVGGVTDQNAPRRCRSLGLGETDHVLAHEIVHAFQRDILKKNNRAMNSLPLWFIEGWPNSRSAASTRTRRWLRDAVAQDDLPRIADLDNPNYFPTLRPVTVGLPRTPSARTSCRGDGLEAKAERPAGWRRSRQERAR
jgi:hypothetical protein